MSNEYTVKERFGMHYIISPDGKSITTGYPDANTVSVIAELLNRQTAPLREELATQALALEVASERIAALESGIRKAIEEIQWVTSYSQHAEDALILLEDLLPDAPQKAAKPDAPVIAPKFAVNEYVGVATYGIDATFYRYGKVQEVRQSKNFLSGKVEHCYCIWFDGKPKPAAELIWESRIKKAYPPLG